MNSNKYTFNKDFIFRDGQIHLTSEGKSKIKRYKKLTGSRIGAVFGNDKFKSPFRLGCEIFNFFPEIEDERRTYFLRSGKIIEKNLREYAQLKTGLKFKTYDPSQVSYDLFKENNVFGGIPDGEELDKDGNVISILEIKTAQMDKYVWVFEDNEYKLEWVNNGPIVKSKGGGLSKGFKNGEVTIPASYEDQLSLYLYLRGITKGYFCIAFIKDTDYEKPDQVKFISEFNNYKNYDSDAGAFLSLDEHILIWKEFNLDIESFKSKMQRAESGYLDHVIGGVSPKMSTEDLSGFRYGYPDII